MKQGMKLELICEEEGCKESPYLAVIAISEGKEYARYYACRTHLGSIGCKLARLFRPLGCRISARQITYEKRGG